MTNASSGHRPAEWAPLAATDPVPGDPAGVRDEADHLKDIAQSLRDQAAELRIIARGEGLRGKYADELRGGALDLEKRLRQVAERYEHVHGHLSSWAGELETFQDESVRLLRGAQSAEDHAMTAAHATSHTSADQTRRDAAVQPYRLSLARLADDRDERAAHYARRINAACDDIIRDSRWERFSDRAGDIVNDRWLNDVFNVLGLIVSVVGIVAMFCTPLGWIVTACAVVGMAMAAKDVLAAMTGNGSWLDVGLDAVGFLGGLALGRALKSLKAIRAATKLASVEAAADVAGSRVMRDSQAALRRAYRTANSRTASRAARASALQVRGAVTARANSAADEASALEHARERPQAGHWQRALHGGDTDAARDDLDIKDMRARFPNSEAVRHASRHAGAVMGAARGIAGANTAVDWGSKAAGAWSPRYAQLEDKYTMAVGSGW